LTAAADIPLKLSGASACRQEARRYLALLAFRASLQ
jgi:hypothetical protein